MLDVLVFPAQLPASYSCVVVFSIPWPPTMFFSLSLDLEVSL